ncbi:MAG TPA: type II toxin-antitoxin system VapC family toxin [Acetobacteraceae bacterium]|nr:type II toxin-antitoxin system VapC family toxin [Acetobacteraceae bacterium]
MAYLDASALASLFVEDTHSVAMDRWLATSPSTLLVSTFAAAELASAVSRRVRMGLYDTERAWRILASFDAWLAARAVTVHLDAADHVVAASLVRRFELRLLTPDALHLAICQRLGLPLLTFDARQAAAARALGIACDPAGA